MDMVCRLSRSHSRKLSCVAPNNVRHMTRSVLDVAFAFQVYFGNSAQPVVPADSEERLSFTLARIKEVVVEAKET